MIVHSFWYGGPLTPYERMCMRSFIDHGHGFCLHTYDSALDVPPGVMKQDAAATLPESKVFLLRNGIGRGSVSIFSDLFRYELLLQQGGWWVDTDVVCLSPALPVQALFFAYEKPGRINCAIMRFPPKHDVIRACRDEAERLGTDVSWGATGPRLLTSALKTAGLLGYAAVAETCYPIDWNEVPALYDPDMCGELAARTQQSPMIHLWNEMNRRAGLNKWLGVPEGCYLDTLFQRHGIDFAPYPRSSVEEIRRLDENRRAADDLAAALRRVAQLTGHVAEQDQMIEALRLRCERREPTWMKRMLARLRGSLPHSGAT